MNYNVEVEVTLPQGFQWQAGDTVTATATRNIPPGQGGKSTPQAVPQPAAIPPGGQPTPQYITIQMLAPPARTVTWNGFTFQVADTYYLTVQYRRANKMNVGLPQPNPGVPIIVGP